MTPKLITYSAHATGRLVRRRITRQAVREILATGVVEASQPMGGAQRWISWGMWKKRELGVVYIENATEVHIVTVQWRDER